jgi:membrane protein
MPTFSLPYTPTIKQETANIWPIIKETASDWMDDHAMRLAAALALYTILSLAPLLVITTKVVSVVWSHSTDQANQQVNHQLTNLMGKDAADAVSNGFHQKMSAGSGLLATIISSAILLFSATGVFAELQDSMNTIWGVKPKPNQGVWAFVRNRLLSLAMVFGVGFLLLVSMFISTILTTAAGLVLGDSGWIAKLGDIVVSLAVVALLFAAIFKFLPDVKLTWRHVWLGAAITAALFTVGKYALAFYFKVAAPTSPFGAAAAPMAVLLWVYYSAFILFFGAEFTKVWSLHHGHSIVPDDSAVKVTEEERAQQGIPSKRRMEKALAGEPFNRLPPPTHLPAPKSRASAPFGAADYALAAGGLVLGAIAGGVGAHVLKQNGKPGSAADVDLKARLKAIEHRIGDVSRLRRIMEDTTVIDRVDEVEAKIRRAASRGGKI